MQYLSKVFFQITAGPFFLVHSVYKTIINRSCLFGASAKEVMFSSVLLCLSLC